MIVMLALFAQVESPISYHLPASLLEVNMNTRMYMMSRA